MRTFLEDLRDFFSSPDFIAVAVICLVLAAAGGPWRSALAARPYPWATTAACTIWDESPALDALEAVHEALDQIRSLDLDF